MSFLLYLLLREDTHFLKKDTHKKNMFYFLVVEFTKKKLFFYKGKMYSPQNVRTTKVWESEMYPTLSGSPTKNTYFFVWLFSFERNTELKEKLWKEKEKRAVGLVIQKIGVYVCMILGTNLHGFLNKPLYLPSCLSISGQLKPSLNHNIDNTFLFLGNQTNVFTFIYRGFHEKGTLGYLVAQGSIDSLHLMSVYWKFLFYEISCSK